MLFKHILHHSLGPLPFKNHSFSKLSCIKLVLKRRFYYNSTFIFILRRYLVGISKAIMVTNVELNTKVESLNIGFRAISNHIVCWEGCIGSVESCTNEIGAYLRGLDPQMVWASWKYQMAYPPHFTGWCLTNVG